MGIRHAIRSLVFDRGVSAVVVACLALVPELPMLATGLAPVLETWRSLPFAGGLSLPR